MDVLILVAALLVGLVFGLISGALMENIRLSSVVTNLNNGINAVRGGEWTPRQNAHWCLDQLPHFKGVADKIHDIIIKFEIERGVAEVAGSAEQVLKETVKELDEIAPKG